MILDADMGLTLGQFRLGANLQAGAGEVVALLGPNGSGKSTVLRAIAGLVALDSGRITLGAETLDDPAAGVWVPPEERPVSVVFQNYLLFPHMSIVDNVAFGLRAAGMSRKAAREQASGWLDGFGLDGHGSDLPSQVSGGQAQRVALARALVTSPQVLLLDEPLSALDAGTRTSVRRDLRRFLHDFEGVTVLVTHDPIDALALADRVVILDEGRVVQDGTLDEVTEHPRSRYVADLVGLNLLRGTAEGTTVTIDGSGEPLMVADAVEGPVYAVIHPHAVAVHTEQPHGASPRNLWPGRVDGFDLLADRIRVRVSGPVPLVAELTPAAVMSLDLHEESPVWISVKATECVVYPV